MAIPELTWSDIEVNDISFEVDAKTFHNYNQTIVNYCDKIIGYLDRTMENASHAKKYMLSLWQMVRDQDEGNLENIINEINSKVPTEINDKSFSISGTKLDSNYDIQDPYYDTIIDYTDEMLPEDMKNAE